MEIEIRSSESEAPARAKPPRLSDEGLFSFQAAIVGKEVLTPLAGGGGGGGGSRGAGVAGCRGGDGPCALTCLVGRAYTVYRIRVRYKERQWIVRKRFRELCVLNDAVQDEELRTIFPPRSMCAKAGLACALETRQSRLAYYMKELSQKVAQEPNKDEILAFLEAIDPQAAAAPAGEAEAAGRKTSTLSAEAMARLSTVCLDDDDKTPRAQAATAAHHQEAFARLLPLLTKGITVIKHGRRGAPKRRLIFCDEDCSRLYWASDRKRSNLSSLALADITEVREGTAPDPDYPGQVGTITLRRRRMSVSLSPGKNGPPPSPSTFSLISPARSLDLEALSDAEYSLLLEGFRAALLLKAAPAEGGGGGRGGGSKHQPAPSF